MHIKCNLQLKITVADSAVLNTLLSTNNDFLSVCFVNSVNRLPVGVVAILLENRFCQS